MNFLWFASKGTGFRRLSPSLTRAIASFRYSLSPEINIKRIFIFLMFGWGSAFLSIFSFSCCNPSCYQPCCLANQEYLNTFPHPVNRLVSLPSLVQVQVFQLFPLAVLAQHLPLELQKDRETKADQEQKQRVLHLIQPICIISENFCNHIWWDFFLSVLAKIKELIHELFSGHVPEWAKFSLLKAQTLFYSSRH